MTTKTLPGELTDRQFAVLVFIADFIDRERWSPTIEEIAAGIGASSKSTAHAHVRALVRKGWLETEGKRMRLVDR